MAIEGDGHCFFRAFSKAITGTQQNHSTIRKAVVQWMLCGDHPPKLASYIAPYDVVTDSDYHSAIKGYIDKKRMAFDGWGGHNELYALATMFQIDVYVSNNSPGGRRWNVFSPLFWDKSNCRVTSDYKLYLYHSDSGGHYDLVTPSNQ